MRGTSGKNLHRPCILEVLGPAMLGMRNTTKKLRTLLGDRPNEGTTHEKIVDNAGKYFTTLSERLLVDRKMADNIDVKNHRLNMGEVMITSRQTQGEIERGEEGLMEVHEHSYGSSLITRSYPT